MQGIHHNTRVHSHILSAHALSLTFVQSKPSTHVQVHVCRVSYLHNWSCFRVCAYACACVGGKDRQREGERERESWYHNVPQQPFSPL